MLRLIFAAAAAVLLASQSAAQGPAPPKLIVEISIDGLSPDLLATYRPLLTGGWVRLGPTSERHQAAGRKVVVAGSEALAKALNAGSIDQRWYWSANRFVTDLEGPAPATIGAANAAIANQIATAQPALAPPPQCLARTGGAAASAFARASGDAIAFHQSPEGDGATLAVSAALVRELGLGRGPTPDSLAIGLSGTGDVARKYGANGQEMCLEMVSLDRDLGDFLDRLDSWRLNYSAVLIAH